MNRTFFALFGVLLFLAFPAMADPITIDIKPSPAPNAFGSPSWTPYVGNALNSLENGLGNIGNRDTDPTAYEVINAYLPEHVMVTSFNSWRGTAFPAAPFADEHGNRLHFGLHITGDGTVRFKLEDLTFGITSDDSALDFAGTFVGFGFNGTTRYGIDWGADRTKGGGDDTIFTSGNGGTLIDELVYVGVGNAYWPGGPGDPLTGQIAIDATAAYILGNTGTITGLYSILGTDGQTYSNSVDVAPVPEPGTLALAALGIGLVVWRRRRNSAA